MWPLAHGQKWIIMSGGGRRGGEVRELTALWEEGFLLDDRG